MAALTVLAADFALVRVDEQLPVVSDEAIDAGDPCYIDPTTGRAKKALAAEAGTAGVRGLALTSVSAAGGALTLIIHGLVDLGKDALNSVAFDAVVYLGDTGGYDTAAGTVSVPLGRVIPGLASSPSDKLLRIAF